MDNRIPKIIRELSSEKEDETQIEFLSFNNWLELKDNYATDWVIVAQRGRLTEYSELFTTSCLIQSNESGVKGFISNTDWFINSEFGIPNKYQTPWEGEEYDDGMVASYKSVEYFPFTFLRNFNNYIPGKFELIQHFLLYYNAFWVEEKSEYHSFDKKGNVFVLVKHEVQVANEKELIKVDSHSLKDYLAVRKCYLARFHDHRRSSEEDVSDITKKASVTYNLANESSCFYLDITTDRQIGITKSSSRLVGKDLVFPYEEPITHNFIFDKNDSDYLDFIIERNDNGKEVESTCNPEKISNYFVDRGIPHFLTPVYFKRELLQKYYAEPKKYKVSENQIDYLNFWGIEYDITNEKLLQVYLGDIGQKLPYSEQLHWKQYNVSPKGKISKHRYERDFLAKFSFPDIGEAPITHFKEEFDKTQTWFLENHNEKLFLDLNKDDQYFFDTLHIPLSEEWKDLDSQILGISKSTTESLNAKMLSNITGIKIGDKSPKGLTIKGPLGLFYEYLVNEFIESEVIKIITPFNMIQSLRSSSVAHRKSKEFIKTVKKYKLEKLSNEDKMKELVINLVLALRILNKSKCR